MYRLIAIACFWLFTAAVSQNWFPDLSKPEDIAALGTGKIIEKDNSIIKQITLKEIREHWVVYIKNASLHDMPMENIRRLEFHNTKWGSIKIEFPDNKPEVTAIVE